MGTNETTPTAKTPTTSRATAMRCTVRSCSERTAASRARPAAFTLSRRLGTSLHNEADRTEGQAAMWKGLRAATRSRGCRSAKGLRPRRGSIT
jgi:hypothetical protein